jgi:adenylate cyclase
MRLVYAHQGKEQIFESRKAEIIIGRPRDSAGVDLDLSPALSVSRSHAKICHEGMLYTVEDLGSRWGTRLNEAEIKGKGPQPLHAGDRITVGEITIRVESLAEAGARPAQMEETGPGVQIAQSIDAKDQSQMPLPTGTEEMTRRLRLLYQLPLKLASESHLDKLLQTLVEEVVQVIPRASRGALLLAQPERDDLALKAHLPQGKTAVSLTLARLAMARREAFIWVHGEEQVSHSIRFNEIGAGMYAPMVWRNEVLGVICVDNPQREKVFSEEDLRLLRAVAQFGAVAVAHHHALEDLRRHADLTKRLFTSRFSPTVRENLLRDAAAGSLPLGSRLSDITVLLSDIRGFTELTREIGPQRMSDLLNEFFPGLLEAIQMHRGTIERMMGDSILAVFGSPEPDRHAEENAVRAALDMQAAAAKFTKARQGRNLPSCEIGIGIECGEALHGFIGNADWLTYGIVGNVPNLASRYCSAAGKGEILVSSEVHSRLFNKILGERSEISTKDGKTLVAFRVQGLREAQA